MNRRNHSQAGYSLIELMVAMAVFAVLMAILLPTVLSISRAVVAGQGRADSTEDVRSAMHRMTRDIREAPSVQLVSDPDGSSWLQFNVDYNGDGTIQNVALHGVEENLDLVLAHHKPGHGTGVATSPTTTTTVPQTTTSTSTTSTSTTTTSSTTTSTTTTTTAPPSTTTTLPAAGAETVRYTYDADTHELYVETPLVSPPVKEILLTNVTDMSFEYRSSELWLDWNGDGTTTWEEIDQASTHGATGVGNNNGVLDVEIPDIDIVSISVTVTPEGAAPKTYTELVELRNHKSDT